MADGIHTLSYGVSLRVTIKENDLPVDISAATSIVYLIRKPDSSLLTVTASFYTNGTDGVLTYTTVNGDTNIAGVYKYQARMTLGGGLFYTSWDTFKVHCNV